MADLCEGGNEPPGSLRASNEMSPGSRAESYPAFSLTELRKNYGKNLNQVTCPNQDLNPAPLVSRSGRLTNEVVWSAPRSDRLLPRERPGTQFYRKLSEPRDRSESLATRKNPVTTWDRTPDLSVRSQLLYQLSYPAAVMTSHLFSETIFVRDRAYLLVFRTEPIRDCYLVNCPKASLNLTSDTNKIPLMRQLGQEIMRQGDQFFSPSIAYIAD
ncbi:hypothetical protein ANN_04295 [Periplaneta americana]|uniref:Uncharacterized protein n=1 Tax=Periplaneta americana TaxID=6978 RepID=A0ABQ8T870_PERAM|nr:hypothetical protein ANN_04295 [Periplaneta americana]